MPSLSAPVLAAMGNPTGRRGPACWFCPPAAAAAALINHKTRNSWRHEAGDQLQAHRRLWISHHRPEGLAATTVPRAWRSWAL